MWLIDTKTHQLKFCSDSKGIRYAILSHTWKESEITFQDMADLEHARKKKGWDKIEQTCYLSRKYHHLKYAWVDTCCIDKTSSAELSEAINSMFSWYKNSKICFVYLSDYTADELSLSEYSRYSSDKKTRNWFTRGWTLQELIAPSNIIFCNRSWSFLGTKESLHDILVAITQIDAEVLQNVDRLPTVHVGRRMSWTSKREATRIEDLAYCLLGIFDVTMPLLYGEGSRAFLRLQQEISRSTNDLTLFAWQQDSSRLGQTTQFSGIFAHSPGEFQYCRNLRVPYERLQLEIEFTHTNRGLRVDRNLTLDDRETGVLAGNRSRRDLIMGLDCIELSERTNSKPQWVGIRLRKIGATYVRMWPKDLYYVASRTWRSNPAEGGIAYIVTSLSELDSEVIHTNKHVGIFYDDSLRSVVSENKYPTLNSVRISYGSMHCIDGFDSQGLHNSMYLHLFTIEPGTADKTAFRLALVCGLRVRTKSDGDPWALLYCEQEFCNSPDHPLSRAEAFASGSVENGVTLSMEEKMDIFHDYVLETCLDESSVLKQDLKRTKAVIRDLRNDSMAHEVSVQIERGSESSTPSTGSSYTYAIRLSYRSLDLSVD
ncbi:heterokaryon incompatibility protein-domain-containing protein [Xylaria scruposa]|nr:heterokaryon incompatibility protein-domain-containing protein [Xylaria scruposa]